MMTLPFFYIAGYDGLQQQLMLDEETSRHIVQVLRMKPGEKINLTDGKGNLITAAIVDDHKKHCLVQVQATRYKTPAERKVSIAISLLKNTSRFEWFLEKATEIGITEIIPLLCERTEKEKFRQERLQGILVSAMLQSQQVWLPVLHDPIAYELLFRQEEVAAVSQKFIAHCEEQDNKTNLAAFQPFNSSAIILIGPEGDFTPGEVEMALQSQFIAVSLGPTRLRTETAGIVAAVLLNSSAVG